MGEECWAEPCVRLGVRQGKGWEERLGIICVGHSSEGHSEGRKKVGMVKAGNALDMARVGQEGQGLVIDSHWLDKELWAQNPSLPDLVLSAVKWGD